MKNEELSPEQEYGPKFKKLTERLKLGDIVYFVESHNKGKERDEVVAPESMGGDIYTARMITTYAGESTQKWRLKFNNPHLLSVWDHTLIDDIEVPGIPGCKVSGVRRYGNDNIHVGNIFEIAIGTNEVKKRLVPDLLVDEAQTLERMIPRIRKELDKKNYGAANEITALSGVIIDRYHTLIEAIGKL